MKLSHHLLRHWSQQPDVQWMNDHPFPLSIPTRRKKSLFHELFSRSTRCAKVRGARGSSGLHESCELSSYTCKGTEPRGEERTVSFLRIAGIEFATGISGRPSALASRGCRDQISPLGGLSEKGAESLAPLAPHGPRSHRSGTNSLCLYWPRWIRLNNRGSAADLRLGAASESTGDEP